MRARSGQPEDARRRNHWELINSHLTRYSAAEPDLRPNYTWSVLHAASVAARTNRESVSVIEVGVAGGSGLVALERAAEIAGEELGVQIEVYGFDTGSGLPRPRDKRDAPFLMEEGDFPMDEAKLTERLTTAELVLGDVAETVPDFLASSHAPVGFISFDVDYYSSTRDALEILRGDPGNLLPRVLCYFDDTHGYPWGEYNGALLAISEFNEANAERKLAELRALRYLLPRSEREVRWPEAMYLAHVFDHPDYSDYEGTELVKRLDLRGG